MKKIIPKSIIAIFISSSLLLANSSDLYSNFQYVENNQVLLYKIINWWNVESNKNDTSYCNKSIKYLRKNNLNIKYNKTSKELVLTFRDNFAHLVDVFKKCKNCYGPKYLENTFLNKKYFSNAKTDNITIELSDIKSIVLKNVSKGEATKILKFQKDMILILEGISGGLVLENNKISLHPIGNFFRSCPKNDKSKYPVSFRIINEKTKESLIEYKTIWNNS